MEKRIAIRRSGAMGDVLMATALLPCLRRLNPGHQVDFITGFEAVVRNNPNVDAVYPRIIDPLRYEKIYDLDLAYENNPRLSTHEAYCRAAGISLQEEQPEFYPDEDERREARRILVNHNVDRKDTVVAFHPQASFWARNWPVSRFGLVADELTRRYGCRCISLGGPHDIPVPGTIDLRSAGTIGVSCAVLEHATLFIGVDSFFLHAARALEVPVIGLFGPIDPLLRMRPSPDDTLISSNTPCRYCHHRQRAPAFVTVCSRTFPLQWIHDALLNLAIGRTYPAPAGRISRILLSILMKGVALDKTKRYPFCMKRISAETVIEAACLKLSGRKEEK